MVEIVPGAPTGSYGTARDIDPTGTYVTGDATPPAGGQRLAFLWSGGTPVFLSTPAGLRSIGYGVNSSGQVVGSGFTSTNSQVPYRWSAGTTTPLQSLANCTRATLWSNGNVITLEPPPGYRNSYAFDINDAGQIVGEAAVRGTDGSVRVPVLWSGGTATVLSQNDRMFATGINPSGQIVGVRDNKGFLWQGGVTFDLAGLLEASSVADRIEEANAISDDGKIAVRACLSSTGRCFAAVLAPLPLAPPVPAYTRYLAEGATSDFFDTQIALLNPGTTVASATIEYLHQRPCDEAAVAGCVPLMTLAPLCSRVRVRSVKRRDMLLFRTSRTCGQVSGSSTNGRHCSSRSLCYLAVLL